MKEKTMKGLYHAALAVTAAFEYRQANTNFRKFLLGGMAGWHLFHAFDHFVREREQPWQKTSMMAQLSQKPKKKRSTSKKGQK
jgi:hypothetical protein